ncbi:MAG: beta family protein [bacterium]
MSIMHYYPVLKSKRTSFFAIRDLKEETKTKIIPIFEIIPEEETKNYNKIISNLKLYLPKEMPVILDFIYLDNEDCDLSDIIFGVIDICKKEGINAIPMTGIGRSEGYEKAISLTVKKLNLNDVAIRIPLDIITPDINISSVLNVMIKNIGLKKNELRLFLDLENIDNNIYFYAAETVLSQITDPQYKTTGIIAGAFPPPGRLSGLRGESMEVERFDYFIWKLLKNTKKPFSENLVFGDYTIRDSDLPYDGFNKHKVPVLRYTKDEHYYIWRGFSSANHKRGMRQFNDACKLLCEQPFFRGKDFSAGDRMIFEKASALDSSSGNQATWAQIGINQHIEFVVYQLAKLTYF